MLKKRTKARERERDIKEDSEREKKKENPVLGTGRALRATRQHPAVQGGGRDQRRRNVETTGSAESKGFYGVFFFLSPDQPNGISAPRQCCLVVAAVSVAAAAAPAAPAV